MKNTIEWKIEVLDLAREAMLDFFREQPVVEGVLYKDYGIPDFLYELLLQSKNKLEIQRDIEQIASDLDIKTSEVKSLLNEYSISELKTAKKTGSCITITDPIAYYKN